MKGVARQGREGVSDTTPGDLGCGNPPAWAAAALRLPGSVPAPPGPPPADGPDGPALPPGAQGARPGRASATGTCGHRRPAGGRQAFCANLPAPPGALRNGRRTRLQLGPARRRTRPPPSAHAAPSADASSSPAPRRPRAGPEAPARFSACERAQAGAAGRPAWGVDAAPGAGPRARARGGGAHGAGPAPGRRPAVLGAGGLGLRPSFSPRAARAAGPAARALSGAAPRGRR